MLRFHGVGDAPPARVAHEAAGVPVPLATADSEIFDVGVNAAIVFDMPVTTVQ